MASSTQVKQYIAHWFQLGKRVMLRGGHDSMLPHPITEGDRYSQSFEACWQQLIAADSGDCYLEGTHQTVQQLLSSEWVIEGCARCGMPVPLIELGLPNPHCPCADLSNWPNNELPEPRSPINSDAYLTRLHARLASAATQPLPPRLGI